MKNLVLFLWLSVMNVGALGLEKTSSSLSPLIYQSLSPKFCFQHLQQFPKECSEQAVDETGSFYDPFLKGQPVSFHFDKELLSRYVQSGKRIPILNEKCQFLFCKKCSKPVACAIVSVEKRFEKEMEDEGFLEDGYQIEPPSPWYISKKEEDIDYEEESEESYLGHRCNCVAEWIEYLPSNKEVSWMVCTEQAINSSHFDYYHEQYFDFLKTHLFYTKENPNCLCYWPQCSKIACNISDKFYLEIYRLIEILLEDLSFNNFSSSRPSYFENRSVHGIVAGLLTNAFFYSQYRQVFLELNTFEEKEVGEAPSIDFFTDLIENLQASFLRLYSTCLSKHPHPKIYYERGMIYLHQGKNIQALRDIEQFIEKTKELPIKDVRFSELYFQQGTIYAECGQYEKAVCALTQAIKKNPQNKVAYFERAAAYFELGDFNACLDDYLSSGMKPFSLLDSALQSLEKKPEKDWFVVGLVKGLGRGGVEGAIEFIPSLFFSLQGLSHGLWVFAKDPIEVSAEFAQAAKGCVETIIAHMNSEYFEELVPELQELVKKWFRLTKEEQGEKIGYTIGKYGVEIFSGAKLAQGIKFYKDLRRANNLLTFQAMAISERNQALIRLEAARRVEAYNSVKKHANKKIQEGKQKKHLLTEGEKVRKGLETKSILTYENPQELIDKFAGTGVRVGNFRPGTPGYQEIVNCKEIIGYAVDKDTKQRIETTWAKIHYAKDGVHIIPTAPRD